MGLHHRVGEEHLPLDGADRENREAAVVRELAEPVGEVALPLPPQPRDPMRRDQRALRGGRQDCRFAAGPRDQGTRQAAVRGVSTGADPRPPPASRSGPLEEV